MFMVKVNIGLTSINTIPAEFLDYFLPLLFYSLDNGVDVSVSTKHHYCTDIARNSCVEAALNDKSDFLFFLDVDMLVPAHTLVSLLQKNVDIISGAYHQKAVPFGPVAFIEKEDGTYDKEKILEKKVYQVDAVGTGCLLVKTSVFKAMEKPYFSRILPNEISEHSKDLKFDKKNGLGEDVFFCKKAKQKGFKIYYDNTTEGILHCGAPVGYELYKKFSQEQTK